MLEEYYHKLMAMCNDVIDRTESTVSRIQADNHGDGESNYSEQTSRELIAAAKIVVDKDGETLTYDKAKKLFKRIELMKRLREDVIKHPQFAEKVAALPRPTGMESLPLWFKAEHERPFLEAIAKWGILRGDLILRDPDLPFRELHLDYIKSLGVEEEEGVHPDELVVGKFEDRFWMRETPILRRLEYYCDAIAKKSGKRGQRRGRRRTAQWNPADSESEMEEDEAPQPATKLKLKLTVPKVILDTEYKRLEKQERRRLRKERKEAESRLPESTAAANSNGEDTDTMLQDAENRLARRSRRSSQATNGNMMESDLSEDHVAPSKSQDLSTEASLVSTPGVEEMPLTEMNVQKPCTSIASLINEAPGVLKREWTEGDAGEHKRPKID